MQEQATTNVTITSAKGRPMLTWVGKRPLRTVTAFPAQHVESFDPTGDPADAAAWADWPAPYPHGGLLFHGDNKEVLAHLLANGFRGKVKLIYIDPPFDSGADYVRKVQLRGGGGALRNWKARAILSGSKCNIQIYGLMTITCSLCLNGCYS